MPVQNEVCENSVRESFPGNQLQLEERADNYEQVVSQLCCDGVYHQWLQWKTQLPDEAIEWFGFKSFDLETTVQGVHPLLPGYNWRQPNTLTPYKNQHTNKDEGALLIPFRSIDDYLLGFQTTGHGRCRYELSTGEKWPYGGKYKWLMTHHSAKNFPNPGVTRIPHPVGEPPLGFFAPLESQDPWTLYLCEGGIKAATVCWHQGWNVLATASGGRFYKNQLAHTIREGCFKRVVLLPDAGMQDMTHLNIAKAYFEVSEILHGVTPRW
jgi:hypothetical protein